MLEEVSRRRHRSATSVALATVNGGATVNSGVTVNSGAIGDGTEVGDGRFDDNGEGLGPDFGTAVHAVLEQIDFEDYADLEVVARACAAEAGVDDLAEQVADRVRAALDSPTIDLARSNPHHRELFVAAPIGDGTVEGYIDLCVETDDGLLVVDYKTDQLIGDGAVAAKTDRYRLQAATYAVALEEITARPVIGCRFLFVTADAVVESDVADLEEAKSEVRQLLAAPPEVV
jgi:ATP-dependent helicase/nuclease subunit A